METTINSIIAYFETCVAERRPLSPSTWLEAASKINVLKGEEYDKLYEMEQECSKMESRYLGANMTSSAAKTMVKATSQWLLWKKQTARVKQIEDFILLSKKYASLKMEEMKNNI